MPSHIPAISHPARNRQVLLTNRPAGVPQASDFTLSEADIPVCADGQILVRNVYLSADPAQRGWASAEANYSAPVPLGGPMRALAVAQVMEARAGGYAPGDFVYGFFGWQDYAAVAPDAVLHKITENVPLDAAGSVMGINGVTAYLALTLLGRPVAGDTLVVSTAAGSVGSFVGQIGTSLGARAIGITGDDAKVARCVSRYGYAAAINYRTQDVSQAVADAAPDGVNVYYDNTGGPILDAVLRRMAIAGRVVQCGTASVGSWIPAPTGPRNEREILTRRLIWSGFVIFDHRPRYAEACGHLADLLNAGKLTYDTDLSTGIETAPGSIASLYAGENSGKKLILIA